MAQFARLPPGLEVEDAPRPGPGIGHLDQPVLGEPVHLPGQRMGHLLGHHGSLLRSAAYAALGHGHRALDPEPAGEPGQAVHRPAQGLDALALQRAHRRTVLGALLDLDEAGTAGALAAADGGPAVAEPLGGGEQVLAVEDFELDAGGLTATRWVTSPSTGRASG